MPHSGNRLWAVLFWKPSLIVEPLQRCDCAGLVFCACAPVLFKASGQLPFTLTCLMTSRGYIVFALNGSGSTPAASGSSPVDHRWRRWSHRLPLERGGGGGWGGGVWWQEALPFITSCCQAAVTEHRWTCWPLSMAILKTPCHYAAHYFYFPCLKKPLTSPVSIRLPATGRRSSACMHRSE